MRKCSACDKKMKQLVSKTPEGFEYSYYKCGTCGEEILDMDQLHAVADKYRTMKRYNAKISKWGLSLGLRIPKELVKKYNFKDDEQVMIIPEEEGIKVIPT